MNPETPQTPQPTQPTQPLQPTPPAPFQAPPVAPFQPTPAPQPQLQPQPIAQQPAAFPQPAASAQAITGIAPPTSANLQKQKKLALWLGIASIAIFIGGFLFGYVFAAAAFLGAYALVIGIRTKAIPQIVIGAIGLALNFGLYTLSLFIN